MGVIIGLGCACAAVLAVIVLVFTGVIGNYGETTVDSSDEEEYQVVKKGKVVGKNIKEDKIEEFYYTYSTSTNPAFYQRYYFHKVDEKWLFFHETREGSAFPLTEEYTTAKGETEITEEQYLRFYACIEKGVVTARKDNVNSGNDLSFFLYWKGDKGKNQVFEFENQGKEQVFVKLCEELAATTENENE